jgi:hypothetical protein
MDGWNCAMVQKIFLQIASWQIEFSAAKKKLRFAGLHRSWKWLIQQELYPDLVTPCRAFQLLPSAWRFSHFKKKLVSLRSTWLVGGLVAQWHPLARLGGPTSCFLVGRLCPGRSRYTHTTYEYVILKMYLRPSNP